VDIHWNITPVLLLCWRPFGSEATYSPNAGDVPPGTPRNAHPHAKGAIGFAEYFSTGGGTRSLIGSLLLDFESGHRSVDYAFILTDAPKDRVARDFGRVCGGVSTTVGRTLDRPFCVRFVSDFRSVPPTISFVGAECVRDRGRRAGRVMSTPFESGIAAGQVEGRAFGD
jgi:hypothetical protein